MRRRPWPDDECAEPPYKGPLGANTLMDSGLMKALSGNIVTQGEEGGGIMSFAKYNDIGCGAAWKEAGQDKTWRTGQGAVTKEGE